MKIELIETFGWKGAFFGMRNPYNSHDRSDSYVVYGEFHVGEKDMELAKKLIKAGSEHRKFLRMIHAQFKITAPSYFMAELDTYKVGITRNSSSLQHKGTARRFTIDDFEVDDQIKEILNPKGIEYPDIIYPYETKEYIVYTCENGRKYEVYRNGRVFALPYSYVDTLGRERKFEKRECKPHKNINGYFELNLGGRDGEKWLLHRLVATVWLRNPNHYATVDHISNCKADNSVENLEWVTLQENIRRQQEFYKGEYNIAKAYKNYKDACRTTFAERFKIKQLYEQGKTQVELAEMFDKTQTNISSIINDKYTSKNTDLFYQCRIWEEIIEALNDLRDKYLDTKDYSYFLQMRQIMPMSYRYTSVIDLNYENLINMYHQRKNHRLPEWKEFCAWMETLPYFKEMFLDE